MRFILDTNMVIYLQKGVLAEPLPLGDYAISIITEIELLSYHALSTEQRGWLKRFVQDIEVVELNQRIKDKTIYLRKEFRLKIPDAIIASTAMISEAILLSNDRDLLRTEKLNCRSVPILNG